jgi:hypothetical protein
MLRVKGVYLQQHNSPLYAEYAEYFANENVARKPTYYMCHSERSEESGGERLCTLPKISLALDMILPHRILCFAQNDNLLIG